jgi:hypothetical protein
MTPTSERERWEELELIGAYAAGELEGERAHAAERIIFESHEHQRVARSYTRMLVMLSALGREEVEAPEEIVGYAVRRAYYAAFVQQVETFLGSLGRSYLDAFVYYLGLRPGGASGRTSYGGGRL